ncbi:MAG: acyl-CoA dehydrogenase family protein [Actinobacteria bacterium]|nr:acyl-CoA dehydrogenase family protein [Actinomycetota bacterium]MCG2802649.1 acyl-CoA dehydrogenase family protein [Cellulomonas sp.]
MDFNLNDEQELLLDSLREWCAQNISEQQVKQWYENHEVPADVTASWVESGFGMLGIPEEFGGTPVDMLTLGMVAEELTRQAGVPMPFVLMLLTMWDVASFGRPDQVADALEIYKTGRPPVSLAVSEPGAGSDNFAMTTAVTPDGDGWRINGQKTWVSSGEACPNTIVVARDEFSTPEAPAFSMWLLPTNTPGVSTAPLHKIGQQTLPFCEMYFDNVRVDQSNLLGERGKGFLALMKNFEVERALTIATQLGLAQAAMDDAAAYTSVRKTFGRPIRDNQLIQEKLTDMEITLQNVRNMLYRTLWMADEGKSIRLESALLKRYSAAAATEVASDAMQIFGGLGYTTETRVGRLWTDCRGTQIAAGTDEIMVHIAGRLIARKYENK